MTIEAHTMITENEKSPLTRNASGQENGTEIEARGLSSAVNGTQTENLTSRKSPAPVQASEATAARPSMEDSTAEGIVDARTAGGNETSSKVSRADALTADEREVLEHTAGFLHATAATALRKLLAAAPVEQPAAAPKPVVLEHVAAAEDGGRLRWMTGRKPRDCELYAAPDGCHAPFLYVVPERVPAPADERAAAEAGAPTGIYDGDTAESRAAFHDYDRRELARTRSKWQVWRDACAWQARASSANETGAEGAAWRELCGRLYVELFHCDQQMRSTRDEDGEPHWVQSSVVRDVLADAKAALERTPAQAAEGVRAWETDDGRVISDAQKQQALRDGGASASSVLPYHIALCKIGPAQAAEPVAIPAGWRLVPIEPTESMVVNGFESWPDEFFSDPEVWDAFEKMTGCQQAAHKAQLCYAAMLASAPQPPAQADAREGLTDEQRDKIERAEECLRNTGRKEDREAANGLLDVLTEHPILPEPRASASVIAAGRAVIEADRAQTLTTEHINALDNAIKIQHGELTPPEPRAEASPGDLRDGTRWRALMKNGEPEVFVERAQRRAIQRTSAVAFSSPNLTGVDRFDTPSEMWVKRYVMFAWWARENEHRKFIEAVDAISAGEIQ
ncbi:hypothetical protein L6Q82_29570 [Burkholderia cenocepacia]|uniref:hypothetical protein n=1 Tax=Burkholderia cenocepacia TaxID=95486 RepID=UPI001F2F76E3|nr:hypothetical protein [Burkholderia cenocepacia]MCG0582126.1 hypothetical protein [Burkholderia cenocepacia]